jgi:uroporphyrinogen-III synthase
VRKLLIGGSISLESNKMLKGKKILVTRPANQAEKLCKLIEENGGIPIRLPTLEIIPPKISPCFPNQEEIDIAIFTSVNAVLYSKIFLTEIKPTLQLAAVGKQTAQVLEKYGEILHPPQDFTSEGLLKMQLFQEVTNKRIALFSGVGGRETLFETLQQRGAVVQKIEVYQRIIPTLEIPSDLEKIDYIVASSGETLENLFIMLGDAAWLRDKPWVLMSERLAKVAKTRGISTSCVIAPQADDSGLLNALITLASLK